MQAVGKVISLYLSSSEDSATKDKQCIQCDTEGIIGDKHHGRDSTRSILITSADSYAILESNGITVPYGILGENLLIDYNPYHLPVGTHLQVGNTILEITQNCTLCKHLAVYDKRIPRLLKKDRGIFTKVVQGGEICIDQSVLLIDV